MELYTAKEVVDDIKDLKFSMLYSDYYKEPGPGSYTVEYFQYRFDTFIKAN